MATNPYFSNNAAFNGKGYQPQQYEGQNTGILEASSAGRAATSVNYTEQLEAAYNAPAVHGPGFEGRMTYDDVVVKTSTLLGIGVSVAAVVWFLTPLEMLWPVAVAGAIIGLVLSLIISFKKTVSVPLILAYAVAEGVFLGGISKAFETLFEGIVIQAVLATVVTFAVTLALYKSGKVRATPKFKRMFLIGAVAYLAFCLVNLGIMIFAGTEGGFGLRSDVEVGGIPLGIIIGIFAVGLAVMSLVIDFDYIQRGVEGGLSARYSWAAAFGLMVTLVWLYIEFLRILAILASRR